MGKPKLKVELNKVVTIIFKDRWKEKINICISDNKPYLDSDIKFISLNAPLAKAILNRRIDEEIEFQTPNGEQKIKIINVS